MSYANLVAQTCSTKVEWFCRFRDFLCKRNGTYDYSTTGIGWTLFDSSYAVDESNPAVNDWFVAFSPGEDGGQDIYVKFTYATGGIDVSGYLYWNASTNTGVQAYMTGQLTLAAAETLYRLWVYGDLDSVLVIQFNNSYYYSAVFGQADYLYDKTPVTCSLAISSGSQTITLSSVPSTWAVGQKIFVRDTANVDQITITAISGNTITATFARAYAAGAKLQESIAYIALAGTSWSPVALISHAGSKSATYNAYSNGATGASAPDSLDSKYHLFPLALGMTGAQPGFVKNMYVVGSAGLTATDTLTTGSATYRYFPLHSNRHTAVKEV